MMFQLRRLSNFQCPRRSAIRNLKNYVNCTKWKTYGTFQSQKVKSNPFPFSKEETDEFTSYFPFILRDITRDKHLLDIEESTSRFEDCLKYNVENGEKIKGLTSVFAYKIIEEPHNLTEENLKLANILGWAIELMEAAINVYCDMINNRSFRQNRLAWYKHEEIGLAAIADMVSLNSSVYVLLRKNFSSHPFYISILNQFHSVMMNQVLGQALKFCKCTPGEMSKEQYEVFLRYQAGYTFCFPFILALYLSKKYTEELSKEIVPILLQMEKFHQAEKNFHNWFVKTEEEPYNDIEDGKCTWLAVEALDKLNLRQRKIFYDNYGKSRNESIMIIKNLYKDLSMQDHFAEYQEKFFMFLSGSIGNLQNGQRNWLQAFVRKIYNQDIS
ncbi:farnesyl pyrophosphate synthase isoform X1 [Leptinotarsa decemlineata]|uniref:farnesyl pyrophosphate synthase isoform X1 n=1 Tax=Leptinotarsa decemlineata TaxID=7539 RepID=UPI003D3047E4